MAGVSFPELLVVISILALAMMVSIPLVSERVQAAKLRAAASQYATTLRAARMVAVTRQMPVEVTILFDPYPVPPSGDGPDGEYSYQYFDSAGREHTTKLPPGAWVDQALSDLTVRFAPDGSLAAPAKLLIKTVSPSGTDTWTVETPVTGVPRVIHDVG